MSTTSPTPEKKDQKKPLTGVDDNLDKGSQSPETLFAAFDKDVESQMTSHVMGAVKRGLDKSRRNFAKEIAQEAIGHMPPGLSGAIDRLPNPKVFEILTAHQQTREFRAQELEAKKAESEVVSKEIDNVQKTEKFQEIQTKQDTAKVDLGVKEEEQLAQEGHEPGVSPKIGRAHV